MSDPESVQANANKVDNILEKSIKSIGIPPRPAIFEKIFSEMKKDEPDFRKLSEIISADVSLAASLIKTANSPFFGIRVRVRSVNDALIVLGLKVASRAIAGIIFRKAFPTSPTLNRFWGASASIARICGWLTQYLAVRGVSADEAYTFGLFRDCGIPILFLREPGYEEVLAKANEAGKECFTNVEDREVPVNHAIVGSLLTSTWWLPDEMSMAIRVHHELETEDSAPSVLPLMSQQFIALAQLSEYLFQFHTGMSKTMEWGKLGNKCLRILDLDESDLENIVRDSKEVAVIED